LWCRGNAVKRVGEVCGLAALRLSVTFGGRVTNEGRSEIRDPNLNGWVDTR